MSLQNKIVIVTGASSGIGEATAKTLAKAGANVVLSARRTDRLKELKETIEKEGGKAHVITADVTSKEDWKRVIEETHNTYGKVDILVNNAGLMPLSFIENLKVDEWDKMVDVNIKGVLNGVASVVPDMKESKSGHIINISSVAGRKIMPAGAVYCATKYAVRALSEGIRLEMGPKYNTKVTSIEPGFVATELTNTITDDDVKDMMSQYEDLTMLQSQDIADSIYYALTQPGHSSVNEILIRPTNQEL
ncbi:SDR family oxidoreductase [Leeuwenhoekiella sp. NPDC079379]|uniref:SDR family oxidoreductase n=1 Tax=Leeuwenhoekiella sp. NPDC079379 TaxID=3364122 RepID=UPI0037CC5398